MRQFLRSESATLFVGPAPAYQPHIYSENSAIRKLAKIQSMSYGFQINREEIKQIGSDDLLTKEINLTTQNPDPGSNIDVNIEPVPVDFSFSYFPTCGLNEYLLNFNVVPFGHESKNSFISRHFGDKNFFILIHKDQGGTAGSVVDHEDFYGHYILGIGNAFATSYSLSAAVNSFIVCDLQYQASNIVLDTYTDENYIPAIHLYDGKSKQEHKYKIDTKSAEASNEYNYAPIIPRNLSITINELGIGGIAVAKDNLNAVSFDINLDISRRNLYGMGSMYPYDRKMILPVKGSLNFSIITKDLQTGNLNVVLSEDKNYDILIECLDSDECVDDRDILMTYAINNAKLNSQSSNWDVNDISKHELSFDFTLTRKDGFLVSGGCLDEYDARGSNEDKYLGDPFSSADPPGTIFPTPFIMASPRPTPSITPTTTITPTITPTITHTSSITPTTTPNPSVSVTETPTPTTSVTPTSSATNTPTVTPTLTPTVTATNTVTPTMTVTPTVTLSTTSTVTPTYTATPTPTSTLTQTITPTVTSTLTPTVTVTPTHTVSPSTIIYDLNVYFQDRSTYVLEGQKEFIKVYRDTSTKYYYNGPFSLNYSIDEMPGSAISGQDFSGKTDSLFFERNQNEAVIEVEAFTDSFYENVEYFKVEIDKVEYPTFTTGNILGKNTYNVIILEVDPTPTPTTSTSVTPSITPTQTLTPSFSPTNTPTITPSLTNVISPSPTNTVTPTVTPTNTVTPTVTPTNTVTPTFTPTHTFTVTSVNHQFIKFEEKVVYLVEGGSTKMKIVRDLNQSSNPIEILIDYECIDGTAKKASDYLDVKGTLTFSPLENEKEISLFGLPFPEANPYDHEHDEYFFVKLSNPRSNSGFVHIDGDNPFPVLIVEAPVSPSVTPTKTVTVTPTKV